MLFSSTNGNNNVVTTQPNYNSTKPNFLCTYSGQILCEGETILDFTSPVNNLIFHAMGITDVSADVAHIDVFANGVFSSTFVLAGNAEVLEPRIVDLSAFSDITRIRIHSITDPGGIGWDTFSFDTGGTTAVPEPATLLLVGAGLVGAMRRRRTKRA